MTLRVSLAALSGAAVLAACAAGPDLSPINAPRQEAAEPAPRPTPTALGLDGEVVGLAFSGGGARAAAFSQGGLLELRDRLRPDGVRWINRVAFVTGVSGGSLTAAWFSLHGPDGLDGLRPALLDKDWQGQIHSNPALPQNWARMAASAAYTVAMRPGEM